MPCGTLNIPTSSMADCEPCRKLDHAWICRSNRAPVPGNNYLEHFQPACCATTDGRSGPTRISAKPGLSEPLLALGRAVVKRVLSWAGAASSGACRAWCQQATRMMRIAGKAPGNATRSDPDHAGKVPSRTRARLQRCPGPPDELVKAGLLETGWDAPCLNDHRKAGFRLAPGPQGASHRIQSIGHGPDTRASRGVLSAFAPKCPDSAICCGFAR